MSIGPAAARSQAGEDKAAAVEALIEHIARLLAREYVALMEGAALRDEQEATP